MELQYRQLDYHWPSLPLLAIVSIPLIICANYLFTWTRFQIEYPLFTQAVDKHNLTAPRLPAALPFIGNAPAFLVTRPNKFWKDLFSWYSRATGACTLNLGGETSTIIFDSHSIHHVFRHRKVSRLKFDNQVVTKALGVAQQVADKFYKYGPGLEPEHVENDRINLEYLIKTDRVNEMTTEFMRAFRRRIEADFDSRDTEVNINEWLKSRMFPAAAEALMGSEIVKVVPELDKLYFQFDQDILSMFFGLPKFMVRNQLANRDKAIDELVRWHQSVQAKSGGVIADPDSIAWEPLYGSRHNRSRQTMYRRLDLETRTAAALDLGVIFAFSSNTIPGAGWMLMHILDSVRANDHNTLYDQVFSEVKQAQNPDGSLNISTLTNQPVLNSCLHEVLRIYVDTIVSRTVPNDMTIPLGNGTIDTKATKSRSLSCKAGSIVMIPSWPAHNNAELWRKDNHSPPEILYPYRFSSFGKDPSSSEKPVFSTSPYPGAFFPFGGGKAIFPGRVFAKQEILTTVAIILLKYEIELLAYVDEKGRKTDTFPGLRDTYPGSALMVANGDLRVKVSKRH